MAKGGREALGVGNRSAHFWEGSELELAWSKKSSLYFENNFPIFLLSVISGESIFKVRDILYWLNFLVMKTSNIFRSTFCSGGQYLNVFYTSFIFFSIIVNRFYLHKDFLHGVIQKVHTLKFCDFWLPPLLVLFHTLQEDPILPSYVLRTFFTHLSNVSWINFSLVNQGCNED